LQNQGEKDLQSQGEQNLQSQGESLLRRMAASPRENPRRLFGLVPLGHYSLDDATISLLHPGYQWTRSRWWVALQTRHKILLQEPE
jgi:hypothetical protein